MVSARVYRRGFTLGEVVISIGILAVLTMAAQSVVRLSLNAVAESESSRRGRDAEVAMTLLAEELAEATSISILTTTSVTFSVPASLTWKLPTTAAVVGFLGP